MSSSLQPFDSLAERKRNSSDDTSCVIHIVQQTPSVVAKATENFSLVRLVQRAAPRVITVEEDIAAVEVIPIVSLAIRTTATEGIVVVEAPVSLIYTSSRRILQGKPRDALMISGMSSGKMLIP